MKKENVKTLVKYLIYFGIAALITVTVFAAQGFFTGTPADNMRVLADGFFVSGILLTLFAGLIFATSKGALLGVGYIFRNVVLALFIPMGRAKQEMYGEYRERKIQEIKKFADFSMLVVGLIFLAVGILLNVIWYVKFYNIA